MKLRKELILFSIVLIVFLAGCATAPEGSTGSGIIITSFSPDLVEVDGNSDVTFVVVVKNVGGRIAKDVKALLFGLSDEWKPQVTETKSISSTLASADPTAGLSGEEGSIDWALKSPAGKSSDITYDASVRVFYIYTTESDTILRFVTTDYLKTAPNIQKGIVSSSSTAGPLVITAVARTPTLSLGATTGRIQFEIQNVGGGRVFESMTSKGEITKLDVINKLTISGLGDNGKCSDVGSAGTAVFEGTSQIRLAGGKSKVISCDIDVKTITNFADRSMKLVAEYNYFTDSATQVKILRSLTEEVTPTLPAFNLKLNPASKTIAKPDTGGSSAYDVTVTVERAAGFTGTVGLSVSQTEGITLATVPPGTGNEGKITFTVASNVNKGTYLIKIKGQSSGVEKEVNHELTIT